MKIELYFHLMLLFYRTESSVRRIISYLRVITLPTILILYVLGSLFSGELSFKKLLSNTENIKTVLNK